MRYALLILAALAVASPALAWDRPVAGANQAGLDKVRAAPAPGGNERVKQHIIDTIKKQCQGTCN